jgi:hypothetical protein
VTTCYRPRSKLRHARSEVRNVSDIRESTIRIFCQPWGRLGRYGVAKLIEGYGADVRMPDLLAMLANCPKARFGWCLRPVAVYERRLCKRAA